MRRLVFLIALPMLFVLTSVALGAPTITTRYTVDGSICTTSLQSEDAFTASSHSGATIIEADLTNMYCPIAQSTLLEYGNFEWAIVNLKVTGTDTDDVVEGCLIAHDYDNAGWADCDCDTHTQASTSDFFSLQLNYVGADPEGTCDVEAAGGWVTDVRVRYSSPLSTTDGAITVKRVFATSATPGWL